MKALILLCLLLCPINAGHSSAWNQSLPPVVFLAPDAATTRIENIIHSRADCEAWTIDPVRQRWFNQRGQILDARGANLGRYFVRGVINNPDGSHVAEYALTLTGFGTLVYSLDTTPEVFPYETELTVAFGPMAGTKINFAASPSLQPGCVWNLNWQIRMNLADNAELTKKRHLIPSKN